MLYDHFAAMVQREFKAIRDCPADHCQVAKKRGISLEIAGQPDDLNSDPMVRR